MSPSFTSTPCAFPLDYWASIKDLQGSVESWRPNRFAAHFSPQVTFLKKRSSQGKPINSGYFSLEAIRY